MKNLKFILFLFSSLFMFNISIAQKIKEDNGLVTIDGEPFIKMKIIKSQVFYNDFIIQSLSEIDLVSFKLSSKTRQVWDEEKEKNVDVTDFSYDIKFTKSGAYANTKKLQSKKMVIKALLKNNLIKNNEIDPSAEKKYIYNMDGRYPESTPIHLSESPIVINENLVTIDGKTVGKFVEKYSDSTKTTIVISVYDPNNGEKIAEAKAPSIDPMEWEVITLSDDKSVSVLYNSPEGKEKLFKWLVNKKYLK